MTFKPLSIINHTLSKTASFLGIKLSAAIISCIVFILLLVLIFTLAFIYWRLKTRNIHKSPKHEAASIKYIGKRSMDRRPLADIEMGIKTREKQVRYLGYLPSIDENNSASVEIFGRFMLEEIEAVTNGLAYGNLIGSGEYAEVFHGFLIDNTHVAVKNLLITNRCSMETFVREAETMMLIRHKNLVKLLGYCAQDTYRMLVYEYVENENLEHWLHKNTNNVSNLTWDIRMKIIKGIAKGLAYLHEDTEPSVVHRNIKSINIHLDEQWNPKISEVGINKFLSPASNYYPPTGMSGYLDPEYDSNRAIDEIKSDVYSFGVLVMEIISGKRAILESTVNEIEEYLVDWIKFMVAEEKFDLIPDPSLHELPCRKELKRILLIALRCVDFEAKRRPKMGEILHMLEPRDLLLSDVRSILKQSKNR
ncbi:hypothetical protein CASFOL_023623 [Castilleja foliolosa]|uniref:non-specific serine/threonine protein kinase n=1 Tax=Castilleja foliolosa TaxID=1961234 RepID=A0ABD3CN27_9LAMI